MTITVTFETMDEYEAHKRELRKEGAKEAESELHCFMDVLREMGDRGLLIADEIHRRKNGRIPR